MREREPKPDISPITSVFKDVTHPTHYTSHPSNVEAILVCRHLTFNIGNAFKYVFRRGAKEAPGLTVLQSIAKDVDKALWYLRDEKIFCAANPKLPAKLHPEGFHYLIKIISKESHQTAKLAYQRFLGLWDVSTPNEYLLAITALENAVRALKDENDGQK